MEGNSLYDSQTKLQVVVSVRCVQLQPVWGQCMSDRRIIELLGAWWRKSCQRMDSSMCCKQLSHNMSTMSAQVCTKIHRVLRFTRFRRIARKGIYALLWLPLSVGNVTWNLWPTSDGLEFILDEKFRSSTDICATLWWNMIVTFQRYELPFSFLLQGSNQIHSPPSALTETIDKNSV